MEWTREKTLMLIKEYQKRRGLWDMTHEDYRKKEVKRELLSEVAEKIDKSLPNIEIEKKFHTLRTQYHREIHRMKQNSSGDYKSKWFAFKHLEFLSSPKACRANKTVTEYARIKTYKTGNKSDGKKSASPTYITFDKAEANAIIKSDEVDNTEKLNTFQHNNKGENKSKKDLEKLIEETTKDDVESIHEIETEEYKSQMKTFPTHQATFTNVNFQNIDQFFEENKNQIHESTTEVVPTIINNSCNEYQTNQQPTVLRIQKTSSNNNIEQYSYEEEEHNQMKNVIENKTSHYIRDEFCIYGEYVSNEMRLITSRDILVTLKHKINTALFEANMAQLQK